MTWLLLIYTVPSEPSRLRAAVWRDLKKAGAVYLRDGVAVLPHREETLPTFRAIAARITEFGGQATLAEGARLAPERAEAITAQANAARAEEYAEIRREAERFLVHAQREREHREFTFAELEEIEEDLGKLRRWVEQVRARDYFEAADAGATDERLSRCEEAVAAFLEDAYGSDRRSAAARGGVTRGAGSDQRRARLVDTLGSLWLAATGPLVSAALLLPCSTLTSV